MLELLTRPNRSGAAPAASDWLLPGRKHGTHTTSEDLRRRLRIVGFPIRPARRGALLALATELPAPVLAEHFAVHQARAAQWTRPHLRRLRRQPHRAPPLTATVTGRPASRARRRCRHALATRRACGWPWG